MFRVIKFREIELIFLEKIYGKANKIVSHPPFPFVITHFHDRISTYIDFIIIVIKKYTPTFLIKRKLSYKVAFNPPVWKNFRVILRN